MNLRRIFHCGVFGCGFGIVPVFVGRWRSPRRWWGWGRPGGWILGRNRQLELFPLLATLSSARYLLEVNVVSSMDEATSVGMEHDCYSRGVTPREEYLTCNKEKKNKKILAGIKQYSVHLNLQTASF